MSAAKPIIEDSDLPNILYRQRHKLIQLGTPIRSICEPFSMDRSVRELMYEKRAGSDDKHLITKEAQLDWWDGIINYEPDHMNDNSPVIVLSHAKYDRPATRKALEAMAVFLDRGYEVAWYTMSSGFARRADIQFKNADVLFISNVVSSSTSHRLETLRDVVSLNSHCLRIIVTAGWHGKDLANATQLSINGLIHIKGVRK